MARSIVALVALVAVFGSVRALQITSVRTRHAFTDHARLRAVVGRIDEDWVPAPEEETEESLTPDGEDVYAPGWVPAPEEETEESLAVDFVEDVDEPSVSMPPSPPAAPNPVFQFFSSAAASASSAMEDAVAQVSGAVPGKAIDTEPELAFVPEPEEEEDRFEPAVEAVNPFKEVAAMADELPPVPPPPPPPLTADNPVAQFFTSAAASASDAVSSAVNDAVAQVKESVDVAVIEAQALPGQLVQSAKEQADEVLTKVAAIPQEAADRAASSTLDYVADARSKVEIARQKRDAMKGQ